MKKLFTLIMVLLFSFSSCTWGTYYTGWADKQSKGYYNTHNKYKPAKKRTFNNSSTDCDAFSKGRRCRK